MFVAVFTWHPDIAVFAKHGRPAKQGVWRVREVIKIFSDGPMDFPPPSVGKLFPRSAAPVKALFMPVVRHLQRGAYADPTKLLREVLAKRSIPQPTTKE
jgi:hypothetical protein